MIRGLVQRCVACSTTFASRERREFCDRCDELTPAEHPGGCQCERHQTEKDEPSGRGEGPTHGGPAGY